MSEAVKVVVRCRPLNKRELGLGSKTVVDMDCDMNQVTIWKPSGGRSGAARKTFTFDAVFDDKSKQKDVYEEIAYPLVESVMQGFNGTIFAYGQTGCGA